MTMRAGSLGMTEWASDASTSALLDLDKSLPREAPPGGRSGEPAPSRLAVAYVHRCADLSHDVDYLVDRDLEFDARQRQLDAREGDGRSSRVAEDARELDEPAERIADEAQRAL